MRSLRAASSPISLHASRAIAVLPSARAAMCSSRHRDGLCSPDRGPRGCPRDCSLASTAHARLPAVAPPPARAAGAAQEEMMASVVLAETSEASCGLPPLAAPRALA